MPTENQTPESIPSLATGQALNAATWADFVQRLRYDCNGEGVRDHCTANAIFIVEARKIVCGLEGHTVTGWDEQWVYVNAHFTHAAAEAFIKRKKHDYRHGMRVYVESQYYAWEFNAIKQAILDGTLAYTPKEAA